MGKGTEAAGTETRLGNTAFPEKLRGRAVIVRYGKKVPHGVTGVIFWAGEGKWGTRVGIKTVSGEVFWTAASNCVLHEGPTGEVLEAAHKEAKEKWLAEKKAAEATVKAAAEKEVAECSIKKGMIVYPSAGLYAKTACKVFWVGATGKGARVGVRPKPGKPFFKNGKPYWPETEPSWLPLSAVHSSYEEAALEAA